RLDPRPDNVLYYVTRAPKDGSGPWTNLFQRSGSGGYRIQIQEDLVFHDNFPTPTSAEWELLQGRLGDIESSERLLSLSLQAWYWIGTSVGVFWTHGTNIYLRENVQ
ncbi:MAG TPA: hypothetical protein VFZ53_13670, partial [Polyangiaceae bacterium]